MRGRASARAGVVAVVTESRLHVPTRSGRIRLAPANAGLVDDERAERAVIETPVVSPRGCVTFGAPDERDSDDRQRDSSHEFLPPEARIRSRLMLRQEQPRVWIRFLLRDPEFRTQSNRAARVVPNGLGLIDSFEDAPAANLAWKRTMDFFEQNLRG
jgi:hypothetical protein